MSYCKAKPTYKRAKDTIVLVCLMCSLAPTLPAGADAPPGRYMVASGTVHDTRTGLTWQRAVDAITYTLNQPGVTSYCENLTLAGGGWRLPTVSELLTLVDPTESMPAIDPMAFPGTPASAFWTSSARAGSGGAWNIDFASGSTTSVGVLSTSRYARCVR